MDSDWRQEVVASRIFAVREMHSPDGARHRLELLLQGDQWATLSITSAAPFSVEVLDQGQAVHSVPEPEWESSGWLAGEPADREEIDRLFHELWTAALATSRYDKSQWRKLALALTRAGYVDARLRRARGGSQGRTVPNGA